MAEESRQERFKRVAKLVVLTLAPVLILVVLAETIASISIYRRARTMVDPATGQLVYTMRIGRWPWSQVATTPLNSLRFPDREFPAAGAQARDSCTHVVFAGDSYVFGDGVDRDSNFVEVLRRRAAQRANAPCLRIFNLGERGTTIDRQRQRVFETMDRLQPDIVILGQYQNDLTDLTNPGAILNPTKAPPGSRDSIRVNLGLLNANIIKMLTYQTFAMMIRNGLERDALRLWSVMADSSRRDEALRLQGVYASLFNDFASKLAARGIAFGVVIFPSKFDILAKRSPEEAFFLQLAEKNRLPHLRIFPLLDTKRQPYTFLMYDGHLNVYGNRLVADTVYDWLFTTDPAPFPRLRR